MKLINFPPRGELKEAETRCDDILPAKLRGTAAAAAGPLHGSTFSKCSLPPNHPRSWILVIRAFILSWEAPRCPRSLVQNFCQISGGHFVAFKEADLLYIVCIAVVD